MTKAFKEAVDAGRAILKGDWRDTYVTFDRQFGITEIRCPICQTPIAKQMPVGAQRITRVKTQTFIQEGVALAYLSNYREVLLEMNDGSRHVANVCQDCAPLLNDPAVGVARYAVDLMQWSKEGNVLSDALCDRSPVKVKKIAPAITPNTENQ